MKKFPLIAASAATLGLVVLGASPAMAAQTRTLPANNTAYLFDCENDLGYAATVDVLTSVATAIGSGTSTPNTNCAGPSSFDAATGDIYWISWNGNPNETLMKFDQTTGASTEIGQFSASGGANAMAINNEGQAYVIEDEDGTNPSGEKLYSLDLATASMTYIANIQGLSSGNSCVWAAAFNPVDDQLYIYCDSDNGAIRKVNLTDGSTTVACTASSGDMWGFAFDSDGILWAADSGPSAIGSYDITQSDCAPQIGDQVTITGASPDYTDGQTWYTESIAIKYGAAPTPALPDTGASAGTLVAIAYTAGGLFVLAAAALFTRSVIRRRKA